MYAGLDIQYFLSSFQTKTIVAVFDLLTPVLLLIETF